MEIKAVHAVVAMILAIGVFASFSGIIPEPTGAATSDLFKVELNIDDSISNQTYEMIASKGTTAMELLEKKATVQMGEDGGVELIEALYTTSWVANSNSSHWVFLVNGERPSRDGVGIGAGRYYVQPDDTICFRYVLRNT